MTEYVKSTNFASKDSLATGNPLKIVKGTEIDTEFNNIATAVATKADLNSPALIGTPTAPTVSAGDSTTKLATTAFVSTAVTNERTATATLTNKSLTSPTLTGVPVAPTATVGDNTTQVATTAFVTNERSATATLTNKTLTSPTISDPNLTGIPVAPTASAGTSTTQVATTAFVSTAITNERTASVTLTNKSLTSPTMTGTPVAPTAAAGTNTTQVATTAFVQAALQAVYPVGSVYINAASATNPATLLGFGTWVEFGSGRVMVGQNASDTLFDTLEETGGSKDAVVVAHTHTGTTAANGAHTHFTIRDQVTDNTNQYNINVTSSNYVAGSGAAGYETYVMNSQSNVANAGLTSAAPNHTHTFTTDSTGSSATNANVQPYIVVKMWKRTA